MTSVDPVLRREGGHGEREFGLGAEEGEAVAAVLDFPGGDDGLRITRRLTQRAAAPS